MGKDLEKVWLSSLDDSLCPRCTVYITCSDKTMWNGHANVLLIHPYMEDDDAELQELWTYLELLLERRSCASVPEYLRTFKFTSTLLREWSEYEENEKVLKSLLEAV